MNSVGTYACDCPDGWTHNSGNQASDGCIHDVDECQENVDICKKNENVDGSGNPTAERIFAVCQNSVGSYECKCQRILCARYIAELKKHLPITMLGSCGEGLDSNAWK